MEHVILVDQTGKEIGTAEKRAAHDHGGQWHRGFSILVFNSTGDLLLQKRAGCKYHFANLWSNTCCGHPRPGEELSSAAHRRLQEEFGFTTPLSFAREMVYEAHDTASGLTEKEFLTVFFGQMDAVPQPNPDEIGDWCWVSLPALRVRIEQAPETFTPWFKMLIKEQCCAELFHRADPDTGPARHPVKSRR